MKTFVLYFFIVLGYNAYAEKTYVKAFYDNGSLLYKGWTSNNQKIDFWVYYYPNGSIKEKGNYSNNLKTGYWIEYHDNKTIKAKGNYVKG